MTVPASPSAAEVLILMVAFATALLGSGAVRRYALASQWLDIPNVRSSHAAPTPRGGGLAIVLSFLVSVTVLVSLRLLEPHVAIALGTSTLIAAIGFVDDRRPLAPRWRFSVHLGAAIGAILLLGVLHVPAFGRPGGAIETVASMALAVFTLTWATNLFNFMDGIDGLAAVEAIFMAVAGGLLNATVGGDPGTSAALLCLGAATGGFLLWNWPPARLFMGDVGSGFLGFTLAVLAFETCRRGDLPIGAWAILSGAFMVDASLTLIRRMVRGERWFEPHRTHAYQHLARRLGSHRAVTLLLAAIDVGWLAPWAWFVVHHRQYSIACVVAALSPLVALALLAGSGRPEQVCSDAMRC